MGTNLPTPCPWERSCAECADRFQCAIWRTHVRDNSLFSPAFVPPIGGINGRCLHGGQRARLRGYSGRLRGLRARKVGTIARLRGRVFK